MTFEQLSKKLADDGYENVMLFNNPDYASAFIGMSEDNRAIYDYSKMVEYLINNEDMSELEAEEFISYNTSRALPYMENGPIIKHDLED